jgi:hypothetical protein
VLGAVAGVVVGAGWCVWGHNSIHQVHFASLFPTLILAGLRLNLYDFSYTMADPSLKASNRYEISTTIRRFFFFASNVYEISYRTICLEVEYLKQP